MHIAVPLFGSRVSPRCETARDVLLATVENGEIRSRVTVPLDVAGEADLSGRLVELGVDVLVCGGIDREVEKELTGLGIRVVNNVAAEAEDVIAALRDGALVPGHGLRPSPPRRDAGVGARLPRVDCMACEVRSCVTDGSCPLDLGGWVRPWLRGEEARIYETGRDVSAETEPSLCRIAELVHFCLGAGYRRLGLAYCWELTHEVEVLAPVLQRFFAVTAVCCRVGSRAGETERPPCNPVAQARILDRAGTDLNVIAGLCLGCDILFTSRSRAPVTTLFVKDRALAHNPVGAIYTRYHLMDLTGERESAPPVRSGRS